MDNDDREDGVKGVYLVLNQSGNGKVVEQVGEHLPNVAVSVFPEAFVVETVDLCDLTALVISSENGDPVAVSDLEGYQKRHRLDRVVTAVNIVAHEEIIGRRQLTANSEELHQVMELAVNVAAYGNGASYGLYVGLFLEYLLGLLAQQPNVVLRERLALAQELDPGIYVVIFTGRSRTDSVDGGELVERGWSG